MLRQSGLSCLDIARKIVDRLNTSEIGTLAAALCDICEQADRSGTSNAFHNPNHAREVGVIWFNLALANDRLAETGESPCRLTERELLIGACAAFAHDIGHDGATNTAVAIGLDGIKHNVRVPFRLETVAANCACDILRSQNTDPHEVSAVRAMILSTDINDGYHVLDAALGIGAQPPPEPNPNFAIFSDASVRLMAAMLRDADIMLSAGLTLQDFDRYSRLIEIELGLAPISLGPTEAEKFFRAVLKGRFVSQAGQLFQPRLDALIAINSIRLADKNLQNFDLEFDRPRCGRAALVSLARRPSGHSVPATTSLQG